MVGGYFMGPDPHGQAATDGAGLSAHARFLNQLWVQSSPGAAETAAGRHDLRRPPTAQVMRAQLAAWHPAAVVAVAGEQSPLGRYLTGLLGPPTIHVGSILGWRLT
jgi:hypothetical protein